MQVEFELGDVELLAHVDVPVRFRHDTGDEPVPTIEFIIVIDFVEALWLRQWAQEVRGIEMGLQLLVGQVIRLDLEIRENVWLWHVDHHRGLLPSSGLRSLRLLGPIVLGVRCSPNSTILEHAVIRYVRLIPDDWSSQGECLGTCDLRHQLDMRLNVIFNVRRWDKSELSLVVFTLFRCIFTVLRLHQFLLHILHLLLILFHVPELAF